MRPGPDPETVRGSTITTPSLVEPLKSPPLFREAVGFRGGAEMDAYWVRDESCPTDARLPSFDASAETTQKIA